MALHAFIDESGQIGATEASSDHFVLSAIVCRTPNLDRLDDLLLRIKDELGRRPEERLHWKNIKNPEQRVTAAHMIGRANFVRTISVVVCKRHLDPPMTNTHRAYLFTLRFLLERLSWLGRWHSEVAAYTISHVRHFRAESLRNYESKLRAMGTDTKIDWPYLDPYGGRISNDRTITALQLADLVASATARAFEPNQTGPADRTYLLEMAPRLLRGTEGQDNVITSYGLKMHPWRDDVKELYPWVLELG